MAQTKINASQTNITAEDIGASSAFNTMPTAGVGYLDKIVQYIGATDSTYTNGYFYKCVSDGAVTPTYSWSVVPVGNYLQLSGGTMTGTITTQNVLTPLSVSLESYTHSIYFSSSYANPNIDLFNNNSSTYIRMPTVQASGFVSSSYRANKNDSGYSLPRGTGKIATQLSPMPTASSFYVDRIFQYIGATDSTYTHGYMYECKAQGTTPETYAWEAVEVQASSGGLPSQTGQSGKFLTTDGTAASWGTINALENTATSPTRSLVINNTGTNNYTGNNVVALNSATSMDISAAGFVAINQSFDYFTQPGVSSINIGAAATGAYSVAIGRGKATGQYSTVINALNVTSSGDYAIAIGVNCTASALNSIQIGHAANVATGTNSDANTFKVANANGNFEMMSADGTIPEARLADMTNAAQGKVLTLDANNNAVWATPSGGGATATTATLEVADWSNGTQTVNVSGVTTSNNVIISAAPSSQSEYNGRGVICTAQGTGTLTFTCSSLPANDLTVNILIM